MKIHTPEITHRDGKVRISARIETDTRVPNLPPAAWFEFPEEYESWLYAGMESFVITMVPLAMVLGEDIHVDGTLSEWLSFHLKHYQQIQEYWRAPEFKQIQIHCAGYTADHDAPRDRKTAMMFSGGLDAIYTLQENLSPKQLIPGYQITHGIFLFNFDFYKNQRDVYERVYAKQRELFDSLGLELLTASHNIYKFKTLAIPNLFNRAFSPTFSGLAHTLSNGIQKLFISSATPFYRSGPANSDMRTDQSLTSERLEIIYDPLVEKRVDKVKALAQNRIAQKYLYVCQTGFEGAANCGRCAKCVRTMTTLEIFGGLDQFELFPALTPWKILRFLNGRHEGPVHLPLIIRAAWQMKRWDLLPILLLTKAISIVRLFFDPTYTKRHI